ncbi:MAG: hypothetical protein A2139_07025 [Desulfobacca sp. RBG_16_60_12]|nr:MAG: hypothetical protein A2139_07025 [Desulfobacca sp. RBG_16_60_12]
MVGFLILAALFTRIPFSDLRQALARGPWLLLGIYAIIQVLITLLADGYATRISLAVTGVNWRLGKVLATRGTTYLLGLVNYALGQGGIGYYLYRDGITGDRMTGIVLFMLIINFGLICLLAALGVVAQGLAHYPHIISLAVWFFFILTSFYLTIIAVAPKTLQRFRGLAPLWQAGVSGHLTAAAGRLPHLFILVLGHWGALRLWGIALPLDQAIILIPTVLVISALPLTPVGLGTTNAAQVILFSPYAPYATPETRAAAVLAFSLIYYVLGIAAQLILGLSSWLWLRRMNKNEVNGVS